MDVEAGLIKCARQSDLRRESWEAHESERHLTRAIMVMNDNPARESLDLYNLAVRVSSSDYG